MASNIASHIKGYDELNRQMKSLGKNFPKAKVRQASRKAVKLPLKVAKTLAPEKTGLLKSSLIAVEEQKWKKIKRLKKAVFQIYFNRAYNSIFQRKIDPAVLGSRGGQTKVPYAYYPYSQEYGFHVAHGVQVMPKKGNFIHRAVAATQDKTMETIIDHMLDTINKLTK